VCEDNTKSACARTCVCVCEDNTKSACARTSVLIEDADACVRTRTGVANARILFRLNSSMTRQVYHATQLLYRAIVCVCVCVCVSRSRTLLCVIYRSSPPSPCHQTLAASCRSHIARVCPSARAHVCCVFCSCALARFDDISM